MIKTIWIQGHKSFNPAAQTQVRMAQNKQANFIYGLNGAGKSAIAEVVDGLNRNDGSFANCRIETTREDRYRYLVYNHEFVDRVVRESMRGIFTVGEVDAARQAKIDELDAENASLADQITELGSNLKASSKSISDEEERAKTEVYKAHKFGKATKLAGLLQGYGNNARKFFVDLRTHSLPEDGKLDSIERLEKRWADVSGTETEKSPVSLDLAALTRIEADSIWGQPVEVSSESRLSELIAKLGNADWVAEGQDFAHTEDCPFCQQTLPPDFQAELAKLLEGERQTQVNRIALLVSSYSASLEALHARAQMIGGEQLAQDSGFALAWSELHARLSANLAAMQKKERQPADVVSIDPADAQALVKAIAMINSSIEDFNARIRDRKGENGRIEKMFFQVLHHSQVQTYEKHDGQMKLLREAENKVKTELDGCKERRKLNEERLGELRRLQKGIDASIEAINSRLKSLGIEAFSIQRKDGDQRLYCLHRPGVPTCSTETLSEGEKTLIAFLYFMESIKGSHDENENIDPAKTIAVIDDPISSLSQNFVYDIATMIVRELTKPKDRPVLAKQVIVLTHNLFFFHELVRQHAGGSLAKAGNHCGLLRVVKNKYSEVQEMDPTMLMNDYDAWWQVLKDAKVGSVPLQVVPNAMRSILEQFFTFTTGGGDVPKGIAALADEDTSAKYVALDRFINRGSHADGINGPPVDWSVYDVPYLLAKLRAMFKAINQEEHYLRKMGIEEQAQVA